MVVCAPEGTCGVTALYYVADGCRADCLGLMTRHHTYGWVSLSLINVTYNGL